MGFSPSEKHYTTTSILSNIVDASTGTFTEGLTVSGVAVTGNPQYILIQDQKARGTVGGTFTKDAWRTRDLNTIVHDGTGQVTLSTNQFTLPAGTYQVHAHAPCFRTGTTRTRLQNMTDTTTVFTGPGLYAATEQEGNSATVQGGDIFGRFTISASKAFEVQQYCDGGFASIGFGNATSYGTEPEIFTQVQLWKVS